MFDDEKIKLIRTLPDGEKIVMIWVQTMCLAGKINDGGSVYMGQNLAYSDEMLATIFNQPLNVVRAALSTLHNFEMIDVSNSGVIDIVNWEKHQNIDGMERIQIQNRERKRRFDLRKKVKELGYDPNDKTVPSDVEALEEYVKELGNVTVTSGNAIEEEKIRTEEDKKSKDIKTGNKLPETVLKNDFEILWEMYPRKERKQDAFKAYKKAIKDGTTNKQIQDGIVAYKKKLVGEGTEHRFIRQGGTWFNNKGWEDEYIISPPKKQYGSRQKTEKPIPNWMDKQSPTVNSPTAHEPTVDLEANEKALRDKMANLFGGDGNQTSD